MLLQIMKANPTLGAGLIALAAWMMATLVLALNRPIIRIKEGYGTLNPAKLWARLELHRFRRLQKALQKIDDRYPTLMESDLSKKRTLLRQRRSISLLLSECFPDTEEHLLPTAFGNVVRAFEMYPQVMYGIEGISGWDRLIAIMPKDYREIVDSAKAHVDFWVNIWALGLLFIAYLTGLASHRQSLGWRDMVVMFAALLVSWWASRRARYAACDWGATVKSAFDIFLPALRTSLALQEPTSREEERKMWTSFSQAVTYRRPDVLPELAQSSQKNSSTPHKR